MRPTSRPIDTNPWGIEAGYGVALTLYPGAPEFEFEIQRAPDLSNAPDEANAETAARVALGNGTWVDPLPNDGLQRWYRYRHVRDGFEPSPWTCWVAGTPREVGSLVVPAAPIVPRLVEDAEVAGSLGTLTLTPTDPQCRVSKVEFRTKAFGGSWSAFTEDSAAPYTKSVDVTDGTGYIGYRVTIYDADGTTRTLESTLAFGTGGTVSTVSILECQARITGATKTTVTVTVDVIGPSDAQVTFESVTGATKASGPNVGVASPSGTSWIFNRPAFQAGTGQARFRAFDAGYQDDQDQAWIEEQGRDTVALLVKCSPLPSADPTKTVVRVRVMDPIPTGAIALTYEAEGVGAVTPASPVTVSGITNNIDTTGYVDFTITRPPERSGVGRVTFMATLAGRTADSDSVDVSSIDPSQGPVARIDYVTGAPSGYQRLSFVAEQGVGPYEWQTKQSVNGAAAAWPGTWQTGPLPTTVDVSLSSIYTVVYFRVRDANQLIGATQTTVVPPPRFDNTEGEISDSQIPDTIARLTSLGQTWGGPQTFTGNVDVTAVLSINGSAVATQGWATGMFLTKAGGTMTGLLTFARTLSAGNQLMDLQQGYGIWSDNVGAGGVSRLWVDAPDLGEIVLGGRASTSFLARLRVRATLSQFEGGDISVTGGKVLVGSEVILGIASGGYGYIDLGDGTLLRGGTGPYSSIGNMLGIGVTEPGWMLHVSKSGVSGDEQVAAMIARRDNSDGGVVIHMSGTDGGVARGVQLVAERVGSGNAHIFRVRTSVSGNSPSDRMVINTAGQITFTNRVTATAFYESGL